MFSNIYVDYSNMARSRGEVSTALTHAELILGVFFAAEIKKSLEISDVVFLGTNNFSILDENYKKFVSENFSFVELNFNTFDTLLFLWIKSRDVVDTRLADDKNVAGIKKEREYIMHCVVSDAKLTLDHHLYGKTFTRLQCEFILAAIKTLSDLGEKISNQKKSGAQAKILKMTKTIYLSKK